LYQISFYVPTKHVQVVKNVLFDASVGKPDNYKQVAYSVFITIQQSERNFFLKGTTFVYVLSSDWLNYWFDT
jgi:hypothetical protein